jgi:hypothetical protein
LKIRSWLVAMMQVSRFHHPECQETRTWQEIAETYESMPHMFSSGSLGQLATDTYGVWACFKSHPCLHFLQQIASSSELYLDPAVDAMCYLYHEEENTWQAWKLKSEPGVCLRQL